MLLKALTYWGLFFPSMCFYLVSPKSSIAKRRPRQLGETHCYFSNSLKKKSYLDFKQAWNIRAKASTKAGVTAPYTRLTRYWAPKPRGLLVLLLWRLDKSTHAGHSRNMKGHEVSNPSRQPVEMSVRHSASTTFHRAKHLFMSEQIGQSSNLFFLSPDFNAMTSAGKESGRKHTDSSVQFTWKRPDMLQDWILILAALTILSERQEQQQAGVLQTFPLSNYTGWLFLSQKSHNVLWKETPGLDQRPQKQTCHFLLYEHIYFCHLLVSTPTFLL